MKDEFDKDLVKAVKTQAPQWHDFKKKLFIEAFMRNEGSVVATARELGIGRIQVWRYKKRYLPGL